MQGFAENPWPAVPVGEDFGSAQTGRVLYQQGLAPQVRIGFDGPKTGRVGNHGSKLGTEK